MTLALVALFSFCAGAGVVGLLWRADSAQLEAQLIDALAKEQP